VLNSLKTDQDVLAIRETVFQPTLSVSRCAVRLGSILPNLISSFVISIGTTIMTMLMAVPAAYALALTLSRQKSPASMLATQMLPPVGIIIPTSDSAEYRLDRHLSGHHPDLSVVLAAVRDLAAGVVFRGHSL
jgi:ABC-type glycerol-3-phosphate transport system permease component